MDIKKLLSHSLIMTIYATQNQRGKAKAPLQSDTDATSNKKFKPKPFIMTKFYWLKLQPDLGFQNSLRHGFSYDLSIISD